MVQNISRIVNMSKKVSLVFLIDTSNSMKFNRRYDAVNKAMKETAALLQMKKAKRELSSEIRVLTFGDGVNWRCGNIAYGVPVDQFKFELKEKDIHGTTPTDCAIDELHKMFGTINYLDDLFLLILISDGESNSRRRFESSVHRLNEFIKDRNVLMKAIGIETDEKASEELNTFGKNGFEDCKNLLNGELVHLLLSMINDIM